MARSPSKGPGSTTRPPAGPASTRPSGRPATSTRPPSKDTARPPTLKPPPSRPDPEEVGPPKPKTSLDEVEQALAALDGRHHDAVRAQRETQLSIEKRKAAAEEAAQKALAEERRALIVRSVVGVVALAVLGVAGRYGTMRYRRKLAADAALAPLAAPFIEAGWKTFPRPIWKSRHKTDALVGAHTCLLALASTNPGDGKLVVERPSGTLRAQGSLAYCVCNDEHVEVHTDGVAVGGVQVLYREAVEVGGNAALPFLKPLPASLPAPDACPVDPLDSWLAAAPEHGVAAPLSPHGLPAATALEHGGWKLVASAAPGLPFAVAAATADSCFLAFGTAPTDALSLRVVGGERPLHPAAGSAKAIGWCAHTAQTATVWRTGPGAIVVYRIPSAEVGGTFGLRERAAGPALALGDVPAWVAPAERAWDASGPLLVSTIPNVDITFPADSRPVVHTRVVSLTLENGHVAPVPDELDRYVCAPSLEQNPPNALCLQSVALGWKTTGTEAVGIAESPLPFWMDLMTQVEDRRGLEVEAKLLALSRRLAAEHYEPTARAGVLEEREGIEVVGQPGYDRAIAVGIMSTAPWVLPYSNGAPWSLEGEPFSIPLAEGEDVHLTFHPWVNAPAEARRTVVFRHRK